MHALAERLVRDNLEASWSAAGMAMAMAGMSLMGVGCTGLQMAIRIGAVMGAAVCLAGWVFAHSEMALHDLLASTHTTVTTTERTLRSLNITAAPLMCSVKGVHDGILLILALQRTLDFWKAISHNLAMLVRMAPVPQQLAGLAALAM